MKTRFLSAVSLAALLSTAACAPTVRWSQPMTMADDSDKDYVGANMLVFAQRRMALPEGWSFQYRKPTDAKPILLWMRESGADNVTGAYAYESVKASVGGALAVERLVELKMKSFSDIVAERTEIDHSEAYIVRGKNDARRWGRIDGWVFGHPGEGTELSQITFLGDKTYVEQHQRVLYTILNTFKVMPRGLSERKLKGSFSFKSDDNTFSWLTDIKGRWQEKGFVVGGPADGNGRLLLSVRQVTTTRFADFINMAVFDPKEFETELHLAGSRFPARAIHRNNADRKSASTVLLFNREGRNYLVEVMRTYDTHPDTIDPAMHDAPLTRAALDSRFYFCD